MTVPPHVAEFIARARLCYVATVNPDGTPNLSPKGSLRALDENHVAFADIASPTTIGNLRLNPAIEINVVDVLERRGYRLRGSATVLDSGELVEAFGADLRRRFGPDLPFSGVVVVQVREVREIWSPAYLETPRPTVDQVRTEWLGIYGLDELEASA